MKAFGADLVIEPSEGGNVSPDLVPRMMEKARLIAESGNTYFTNQLYNKDSIVGYRGIGRELLEQVGRRIDAFCGAVGTAGMLMGVSQELRRAYPEVKIIALEPGTSAVISGGEAGSHRVEGIGIGFIPPLLAEEFYDEARGINEQEGRRMAQMLAKEEGIFAGTSSGLNVVGALQLGKELGPGKTVVTVAVDTGLKYLAGDLYAV
jgi:cysteine synthase A